jgi:hypothetical protein
MELRRSRSGRLTLLVLLLAVVGQAVGLSREYLLPWGERIWAVRSQSPWERSARLSVWMEGEDVDFIMFLRVAVPAGSEIVFVEKSGLYSWRAALQYLLFPRRISVCDLAADPDCFDDPAQSGAYFVVVDGRPLSEQIPPGWRFVPFTDGHGYYAP